MKYLLVIAVVCVAFWIWREGRRSERRSRQSPPPHGRKDGGKLPPEEMTRCAQCGLHLPLAEAVAGRRSLHYCSDTHRKLAER